NNESSKNGKLRELEELENQIGEGKAGFMQALNSMISEVDSWKSRHLVTASQSGTVVFAGVIQENQFIEAGKELFYINPGSGDFFGEINIPQYNMGKVKSGQKVLVKLDSYPFEEFGAIEGQISHFSHVPVRDSIFISKVNLDRNSANSQIFLRTGL